MELGTLYAKIFCVLMLLCKMCNLLLYAVLLPSVLLHWWLDVRNGIWPEKNLTLAFPKHLCREIYML